MSDCEVAWTANPEIIVYKGVTVEAVVRRDPEGRAVKVFSYDKNCAEEGWGANGERYFFKTPFGEDFRSTMTPYNEAQGWGGLEPQDYIDRLGLRNP